MLRSFLWLTRSNLKTVRFCSENCSVRKSLSENGVFQITLNRPERKNALTWDMFVEVTSAFNEAMQRDDVKITTLTGSGEFFTSGLDLNDILHVPSLRDRDLAIFAAQKAEIVRELASSIINHPKPVVLLVNGPAIGLGASLIGLCDIVYASRRSYFRIPIVSLGINPVCCSSLIFPERMGPVRANRFLLRGEKMSSMEAEHFSLVSEVFEDDIFREMTDKKIGQITKLSQLGLNKIKWLCYIDERRDLLIARNGIESEMLEKSFKSAAFIDVVSEMVKQRKSNEVTAQ